MNIVSPTIRNRRHLRFHDLDDVLHEARRIANARHVRCLGNWTPGQIFEHLAKSFQSSIRPSTALLPLWMRVIARMLKPFVLRIGLPSGFQIEKTTAIAASEFLPDDDIPTQTGLVRLEKVVALLRRTEMTARHNLFGRMTHRDWEMMHCRHAELHLGFVIADG